MVIQYNNPINWNLKFRKKDQSLHLVDTKVQSHILHSPVSPHFPLCLGLSILLSSSYLYFSTIIKAKISSSSSLSSWASDRSLFTLCSAQLSWRYSWAKVLSSISCISLWFSLWSPYNVADFDFSFLGLFVYWKKLILES